MARPRQVKVAATPVVSTSPAYTAGDAVGGKLTFVNAARESSDVIVQSIVLIDRSQQRPALDLYLFDRDFTPTADNAPFDPTDADLENLVGIIGVSSYGNFVDNSAASRFGLGNSMSLAGPNLYGQFMTTGTPAFASTSDLTVVLSVLQDY